ncbi:hypothetical protein ABK040_003451 [Willaertia magna]
MIYKALLSCLALTLFLGLCFCFQVSNKEEVDVLNLNKFNEGLLDIMTLKASQTNFTTCYACMIDAGSSGSRIYIYKFPCRQVNSVPSSITEVTNQKTSTPISGVATPYATSVPAHLKPLIDKANATVPANQINFTPVIFRATAGLRLLTTEVQNAILAEVRKTLASSGFYFLNDGWATVMSGAQEGVFGWVSVNYISSLLKKDAVASSTYAAIDLGGASMQVTFVPESAPAQNKFTLDVEGVQIYNLYTYSFLGYGNDESRNAVLGKLVTNGQTTVKSPCFNVGYSAQHTLSSGTVTVNGTGSVTECRALIRQFLNITCANGCTIQNNYFTPIPQNMKIYGFSSLAYLTDYFGMNGAAGITPKDILTKTESFCTTNYASVPANAFANTYCFLGSYAYEILTTAYGINEARTVYMTNTLNSISVNWALGAAFYEVGEIPCKFGTENCKPTASLASNNVINYLTLIFAIIVSLVFYIKH